MATCKDCKFYGVCIMNRRSADADVSNCKVYEAGIVFEERDLVEVVRCKDCKWYQIRKWDDEKPRYDCRKTHALLDVRPDDFCSYGERREGE